MTTENTELMAQIEGGAQAALPKPAEVPAPLPVKTAQEILDLDDRQAFPVEVPEWGCTVMCRELDAEEALEVSETSRSTITRKMDSKKLISRTIAAGCVEPVFTAVQALQLMKKSNNAINRLFNAINDGKKK